jgi:hypothetical protein
MGRQINPSRRVVALSIVLLLGGRRRGASMRWGGKAGWCTKGSIGGGAILSLAIAASLLFAMSAAASSRFVLEYCDPSLPQTSDPFLTFAVSPAEGVPVRWFNDCLQPGGSIGIQEVGNSEQANAALSVYVPPTPGGYVESESILGGTAALGNANDGTYIYEPGWPFPNGPANVRTFRIRAAPPVSGEAGGNFSIDWNCDGAVGSCSAGPIVYARDISVTEVDPTPPTVTVGGPLLSGGVARGGQALEAIAQDVGGGVSRIEVLANGLPAAAPTLGSCGVVQVANPAYEGIAATTPSPCPPTLAGSWSVDTASYPFRQGANEVEVCASDFATQGTPDTTCSPPQTVTVDNSCTESQVAGGQNLSAAFSATSAETVTVGSGGGAEVRGTLTSGSGQPVSGATICVQTQTEGSGTGPQPVATATTDAAGDFDYGVDPGPDRQVVVGYRHGAFQVARSLTVQSHAEPTFVVDPPKLRDGQEVQIRGALPQPEAAGRVVVLQANVLGSHRWITFRKATTGPRGGFRSGYRFHSTTRKTIYRFRALVPRQNPYPYIQGHSKPASVLVRPRRRHHHQRRKDE